MRSVVGMINIAICDESRYYADELKIISTEFWEIMYLFLFMTIIFTYDIYS